MTKKAAFIVPGSLEAEWPMVRAAVTSGAHAFDPSGARYVEVDLSKIEDQSQSVEQALFDVYDNSTGSLLDGDFKVNA